MSIFNRRPAPAQPTQSTAPAADQTDFTKRLDAMSKAIEGLAALSTRTQQTLATLAASQGHAAPASEPAKPAGQPGAPALQLPDALDNPTGFATAVVGAAEKAVEAAFGRMQKQISDASAGTADRQAFYDDLSAQFDEQYPDLAKDEHQDIVKDETAKIVKRLMLRKVDADKYIQADPEGFMERVAQASRVALAKAAEAAKGGTQDAANADPDATGLVGGMFPMTLGGKPEDNEDMARMAVLAASAPPVGAKPNSVGPAGKESYMNQMADHQKKLGLN